MSQPATAAIVEVDPHFRTDHLVADLKGRSVRGGAVTVTAQAVKFVLQIGSTAVLARLISPADFGLVAMVATITSFVALFKDLGLSTATVQSATITHEQVNTLFWVNVLVSLVLTMLGVLLAPAVAWFYHEARLTPIMAVTSTTFLFGGVAAQHTALLRRQMRFSALAVTEVVPMMVGIAVAIALALAGAGYWALVAMGAANAAATMTVCWSLSGWRPGRPRYDRNARAMLSFGGNLTGSNVLNYFTRNADNIIVGEQLGAATLGIYSKAYALLLLPIQQFNVPIASVALPALSRLTSDEVRFRRYFRQALEPLALVGMPMVAFSFVNAELLISVFLGRRWMAAVPVFRLLAPAAFVGTLNVAPGWVLTALGRTKRLFHWWLFGSTVIVAGFVIGVHWGVSGVAIACSVTLSVTYALSIPYAFHDSPVRWTDLVAIAWRPASACMIAAMIAGAVTIAPPGWPRLVQLGIAASIYGVVYAGVLVVLPGGYAVVARLMRHVADFREGPKIDLA